MSFVPLVPDDPASALRSPAAEPQPARGEDLDAQDVARSSRAPPSDTPRVEIHAPRRSIPVDPRSRQPAAPPGWVARIGHGAIDAYRFWAASVWTLIEAALSSFTPGRAAAAVVRRVMVRQLFFTGVQGLPFVTATALIIGATFMLQTRVTTPGLPGEVVGQILVAVLWRELAPLVTAIIVASRSGTAIATELGNMQANLEIQALASMGVDPPRYVVLPRLIGAIIGVLVLTVYFSVLAIAGALTVAIVTGGPALSAVRHGLAEALGPPDLVLFAVKGTGCGVMVGWLCCHFGMLVRGSPTEVPMMTGRAVIRAVLGCVVYNFAVTIAYYSLVTPMPLR
jgi:phospholipid/cholesterol/gamma-HCH transport system permease protein